MTKKPKMTEADKRHAAGKVALVAAAQFGAAMLEKYDGVADLVALGVAPGTGNFAVTINDVLSPSPKLALTWTSPTGDVVLLGAVEFEYKGGSFIPTGRPH